MRSTSARLIGTGPPAVIGIPLADVLALDAASPGVWARADLIDRIRRR